MRELQKTEPLIVPECIRLLTHILIKECGTRQCKYCHNSYPKELIYGGYCVDCMDLDLYKMGVYMKSCNDSC